MIIDGVHTATFGSNVPAFRSFDIPCEEIMSQPNFTYDDVNWIFGARQNSGSDYAYVSDYYFDNPNGAQATTGYFGTSENALSGNCLTEGERTITINENLDTEYVLVVSYRYDEGYIQEEWYNFHTTNPFGIMVTLFIIGAMLWGVKKLIASITP
jgi:hypothetical protein